MEKAQRRRVTIGLVLLGLAMLFFVSVVSYSPDDPIGWANHPRNENIENMVGPVGAYAAHASRFLVGTGCYLIVALMVIFGAMFVSGRQVADPITRVSGIALLLASWCAGASILFAEGGSPFGHGGIVGYLLDQKFLVFTGPIGSHALVILGALVGVFLAADAIMIWAGRKSVELLTYHGAPKQQSAFAPESTPLQTGENARMAEQKEALRQRLMERDKTDEVAKPTKKRKKKGAVDAAMPELPDPVASKAPVSDPDAPTLISRPRKPKPRKKSDETSISDYVLPSGDILDPMPKNTGKKFDEHIEAKKEVLERTLEEFRIAAQVVEIDHGPVITLFELEIAPGIKITRIVGLADDMARALKATSVRVVAPIPGKSTVGVEVPNSHREIVRFRELYESGILEKKKMNIPLLLGKDASGAPLVADLAQMPHMLVAGATGSGKSVCINSIISSFLMTQFPDELKLILIDPKMVELSSFRDVPHLMTPVVTDMKKATAVLEWACKKMDERYSMLANVGARNISAYNSLGEGGIRKRLDAEPDDLLDDVPFHMPYIVIIIDELADLMMTAAKEVENSITRIAQKSRAVGIHLIVATQRPSVDVVTGLIKANLPCRLAFQTASKIDSRTILDRNGSESLLGQGDMLFLPPATSKLIRAQGSFTSDKEIRAITKYLADRARPQFEQSLMRKQSGDDDSNPELRDELYEDAARIILESQRGSVSLLQRKLGVGYSRAARLVDIMADCGLVGDYKGSQAREVLVSLEEWEAERADRDQLD
jgi:DNA segregation ATPase FtsK/SpoIIIE, S-DNA-T family